jgi:hypothetical protein
LGIDRIEPLQLEKGISSASIVSNTGSNNTTPPPSNVPPVVTPPTPTGDGNNVPTPVSKRVKGHRAHIEVDGKHTYELTDSDVTYHYVWDTDNNELRVYSIRLTRDKETNKVIDHRLAAVDPITGSTFAHLSGGNKDILITPELVLSSVIAGGVTVQGYAQNPGNLTQEQRDKANTDLTSKVIKKRIAIEEESIAMFAEMGITTGPQIDKINARIKELKALLNSVPPTPASTAKTTKPEVKVGDTSTEVKGRFTITKTVVSDNTVLSVRTNNEDGKVTKSEYVTTYPDIYTDEFGDKYTIVIYRDSANPSDYRTDVKCFDVKDEKNTLGSYGKGGTQTDEKFITTFTEASDVTLEYTNKFEKSLPVVKPKTPTTATPKQTTPVVEAKSEPVTFTGKMTFAYGSNKRSDVESNTTFDAIKAGERTATTRYTTDGKIDYWSKAKVGDIIEFSNKDGDIVRVEVTKPLTKLPLNTDGETWSKKEGWSIDYFNKNVKPKLGKAYQLEYKLIGKAEPKKAKTPESTPPVVSEPIEEEIKPPKAFELNDGQKKALAEVMEFINDSRQTFSLVGPAGTGKTTVVNTIIAALRKAGSIYGEVTLTSPTHRANTVTRSKNPNETVVTLHKLLSLSPSIDLDNLTAEDVKFAQRSMPEDKDPFPKKGLVIVDESSMMNKELYNFLMIKLGTVSRS